MLSPRSGEGQEGQAADWWRAAGRASRGATGKVRYSQGWALTTRPGIRSQPTPSRLVVLAYHDVVDADCFSRQMDFVGSRMQALSLDDVVGARLPERRRGRRPVLVTFDDGDRSVYDVAMPILRARGIPAVLFVVAGHIGTLRPLWFREARELVRQGAAAPGLPTGSPDSAVRALKRLPNGNRVRTIEALRSSSTGPIRQPHLEPGELRVLEANGIEIGNHTLTHPCLDRCTGAEVRVEIERAHEMLSAWLGRQPRTFSYPNGNPDLRADRILRDLAYETAFLFDHRVARMPLCDRLTISRVRVNSTTRLPRFRSIVSGLHPFVHHALGRR